MLLNLVLVNLRGPQGKSVTEMVPGPGYGAREVSRKSWGPGGQGRWPSRDGVAAGTGWLCSPSVEPHFACKPDRRAGHSLCSVSPSRVRSSKALSIQDEAFKELAFSEGSSFVLSLNVSSSAGIKTPGEFSLCEVLVEEERDVVALFDAADS